MGKLYFYYGAMGSSKSAQLLMNAHSFEERNVGFVCLKPSIDTRDGQGIIKSRVGIQRECIFVKKEDNVRNIIDDIISDNKKVQWVLVDESQFLTSEQVEQLANVVDDFDINVICYGLRTDFRTKLFEGSQRLMELADTIEEIKISCSCGNKAIINARMDKQGNVITEGEQIMLGDSEYVSLCRKCYYNALKKC